MEDVHYEDATHEAYGEGDLLVVHDVVVNVRVALDTEDPVARFRDLIEEAGAAGIRVVPAAKCRQCECYVNGVTTSTGELSFVHDCHSSTWSPSEEDTRMASDAIQCDYYERRMGGEGETYDHETSLNPFAVLARDLASGRKKVFVQSNPEAPT